MQDRYTGDVGDFGKFGLMRTLVASDSSLRLGLIWYLFPDEGHNADGKHIGYLESSERNDRNFRACDNELYDRLRRLVASGKRQVSTVPTFGILPRSTVYFEEPLHFPSAPRERAEARAAWFARALEHTAECDIVVLDPDNGMECRITKREPKAGKYVYLDEIASIVERGQSVVLYQHLDRSASAAIQIERRAGLLVARLRLTTPPLALRHSSRVYYFLSQPRHEGLIHHAITRLTSGPWARHFSLA